MDDIKKWICVNSYEEVIRTDEERKSRKKIIHIIRGTFEDEDATMMTMYLF